MEFRQAGRPWFVMPVRLGELPSDWLGFTLGFGKLPIGVVANSAGCGVANGRAGGFPSS